MKTRYVEATQAVRDGYNHGKFAVSVFDKDDWAQRSEMDYAYDRSEHSLLARCGWTHGHALVLDLETGEGAIFRLGGSAEADLGKHKVWVCPMYEPFLTWLYEYARDPSWFAMLPALVELPTAEPAMFGYRRGT